jgi:hypothetical protein
MTLKRAQLYLEQLGIQAKIRPQKNSTGHKGTKTVYQLALVHSSTNFSRFAWLVGSNIARKRDVLFALPLSYTADMTALMRQAQRKGAEAKHRKTMEVTLPAVVEGIRKLIRQGIKPTQQACRSIPGYHSVYRWVKQGELVAMALEDSPAATGSGPGWSAAIAEPSPL